MQDNNKDIIERAEHLRKSYQKLSSNSASLEYQKDYFKNFPASFYVFNHLFGYSDGEPLAESSTLDFDSPLYDKSYLFIELFYNLRDIDKIQYYNRIIDLSINGRWYADGVSIFQHGMQKKVKANINLFCELLSSRNEKEIKSFWYFYFDGPAPAKQIPTELQNIKEIDSKNYHLIELALKEVQQNWKDDY